MVLGKLRALPYNKGNIYEQPMKIASQNYPILSACLAACLVAGPAAAASGPLKAFRFDGVISAIGSGDNAPFTVGQPFFIEYVFDTTVPDTNAQNFAQTFEQSVKSFTFDYDNGTYVGAGNDLPIVVNNGGGFCTSICNVFGSALQGDDVTFAPVGGQPMQSFTVNLCDQDAQSFGAQDVPTTIPFGDIELSEFYLVWELSAVELTGNLTGFTDFPVVLGDVNGDGTVSAIDASQVARHSVGLLTLGAEAYVNAEVNGDTNISAIDASLIARYSVGLITQFPADAN